MTLLTIVASNRDRLDLKSNITKWFIKSIQWQDFKDVELLVADGGSRNYEELKEYFEVSKEKIPMRIVQHKIGEPFERAKLNNVGVRNAVGKYILTTDVDMLFAPQFVSTVMKNVGENFFVESRTMYWKDYTAKRVYNGELNPYNDINSCKIGRIKKRTTAGGCQCMHINQWNRIRGFDENFIGWGSEDYDLLTRVKMARIHVKWLGESHESIMLFHQPHIKTTEQLKKDLEYQGNNKKLLESIKSYQVNPNGWGGKPV